MLQVLISGYLSQAAFTFWAPLTHPSTVTSSPAARLTAMGAATILNDPQQAG